MTVTRLPSPLVMPLPCIRWDDRGVLVTMGDSMNKGLGQSLVSKTRRCE
jgi:hypothetical protein